MWRAKLSLLLALSASICNAQQRPDSALTPGAIRSDATAKQLCAKSFRTGPYRKTTAAMKKHVCALYGMPWHCWGPGSGKVPVVYRSPHDVLAMRDGLQVGGIHAISVPAQVVDLHSIGDGATQDNPEQNVSADPAYLLTFNGEGSATIAPGLHPFARPQPASIIASSNFGEYRSVNWFSPVMPPTDPGTELSLPAGDESLTTAGTGGWLGSIVMVLAPAKPGAEFSLRMPLGNERHTAARAGQIEGHGEQHFTKGSNPCIYGCEADHIVPLELGGLDDERNLWPQPYYPRPGAHEKDHLENYLKVQVCTEHISLADAQHELMSDWAASYEQHIGKLP